MRPPVDLSALVELRKLQQPGRPDAIARIIGHFLEETALRLASLHTAVAAGDARTLEWTAHALKGISGTVGANEILDLATRLEEFGRGGDTAGAADLVSELDVAFIRAQPIFDRLRGVA